MVKAIRTDQQARSISADPEKRLEVPDALLKGLYLIVQPSGAKSWAVRYRRPGDSKAVKLTLGKYPLPLGLADAREAAAAALRQVAAGIDPAAEKKAVKVATKAAAAETRPRDSLEAVAGEWLKRDQAGNRSAAEVARILAKDVYPALGARRVQEITRRDVIELIDAIADRGAVTMARRVHAHLHRLFRWCVARGIIEANPMTDLPKPGRETRRERVLSDGELVDVWRAAEGLGWPFGPALHLLILTGARREEIGSMRWPEVDIHDAAIKLEGSRTKNGQPHTIPLSAPALAIAEVLPVVKTERNAPPFVFSTTGATPISGWSKAKAMLDARIASARSKAALEAGGDPEQVEAMQPWRLHDLRRTVATGLQRLGVRLEVIEATLGHVSGSRAGVVGVYQRHAFKDEKRVALEAWGRHMAGLVKGRDGGNVVPMRQTPKRRGA